MSSHSPPSLGGKINRRRRFRRWRNHERSLSFLLCAQLAHHLAGKGVAGSGPIIEASKTKMTGGGRLWILGIDGIKSQLFDRLGRDQAIYFSNTLPVVFYEQLCAERRVTRYFKGRPDPQVRVDCP